LLLGQRFQRIASIHDDSDTVVGDDSWLHIDALGGSGADLGGFGATTRHPDLGGAINDRGNSGSGTLRGDVEGSTGMLRLELFGQLRHQLRSERIGTFDDQAIRVSGAYQRDKCN